MFVMILSRVYRHPVATIFPAKEVQNIKQAPVVADFSSRGPAGLTEDILKVVTCIIASILQLYNMFYSIPTVFNLSASTSSRP